MDFPPLHDYWFLTGPTASGKSAVGVELARRIGAEIISMDSMALYRGMDIGTAKPTAEQRRSVPHHLIDVLEPHEEFSLAQYIEAADRAAAEIARPRAAGLVRRRNAALLERAAAGHFSGSAGRLGAATAIGRRGRADTAAIGCTGKLAKIDPAAAARLHPNDARRLIRAIEVFEKTGRPISAVAAAIRDWPPGRGVPRVRARLAQGGASAPDRTPRPRNVRRRIGRGSPPAVFRKSPLPLGEG